MNRLVLLVKKIFNRARIEIWWGKEYAASKIKKEKTIILSNTPIHGNLGDQALVLAENNMFRKICPAVRVREITTESILAISKKRLRMLIGESPVCVHAGGFIGTIWPTEEDAIRKILEVVNNNQVIILPQTITYLDDMEKEFSKLFFGLNRSISLCVRERDSVAAAKEIVGEQNVYCVPDMVISYLPDFMFTGNKEKKCLLCMRNDVEKKIDNSETQKIVGVVKHFFDADNIEWTDTVVNRRITNKNRTKEVRNILDEFSKASLVITDRLHGMIFAARTGVPCIALNNTNRKVSNVYEWIRELNYIEYIEDVSELEKAIQRVMNAKEIRYPSETMKEKADVLRELIIKMSL